MRIRDIVSFAALAALIGIALTYIGALGVQVKPPDNRVRLSMTVHDINSLVVDANVLLRGVSVGKVTGIDMTVDAATIDFYVDARYKVPVDTEVRLENLSALGESYIGLFPRSTGGSMLQDGQRIATEFVVQPPSIGELATSVVRLLSQLDPGALKRIVDESDAAFPDPTTVLPNINNASVLLLNSVRDLNGRGGELLDNFQVLLQNAGWVGGVLTDVSPWVRQIGWDLQGIYMDVVSTYTDQAPVPIREGVNGPANMVHFGDFLERIQKLLDDRGGDIKVLAEAMRPKVAGIAGALMNFDTGQLLDNVLATVPEDGTINLRVTVP
jgi:hypothetical protein